MTSEISLPRVALLTWCTPESRYAGGAAIRRLLSRMPADRVRWCGFHPGAVADGLPAYRAFPPRQLHWRLAETGLAQRFVDTFQARAVAAAMWSWLAPFQPQVLWVVPEVWAVSVGRALQRLSGLPLHATVHDAPETARQGGIPASYAARYEANLRALLREADSVDAVSDGLLAHLRATGAQNPRGATLVIPPSVAPGLAQPAGAPAWAGRTGRRIGLCGSLRQSAVQWRAFLEVLGQLPVPIAICSFTPRAEIPDTPVPANVTLTFQPYTATESDVVQALADVDATYLGLWTEADRRIFGDTSLSSKLTTYAAAARPVIVDAAPSAVAWQLVERHQAGVRMTGDPRTDAAALTSLLGDAARWSAFAAGARRLCLEHFDLDRNATALRAAFAKLATVA